jgi:acyl-CoA reductase-like NAD-dependent aldehyde dehydrogenase
MYEVKHYIDGKWHDGSPRLTTVSPSNLAPFASAPIGGPQEVAAAVMSAKRAFKGWSELSCEERAAKVNTLVALLREEYGESGKMTPLKQCIVDEVGKPLPEADLEVLECADFTEYYAQNACSVLAEHEIEVNATLWPTKKSLVTRGPIGVVGIIKPWNYPIEMVMWSLAPAILAGNTVLVKPSEKSPASNFRLAQIVSRSEVPPGVVNFVFGDSTTGKAVVANEGVRMVSFTGSVNAGRDVSVECARQLKKAALELGGNDAALVLEDADIELAANGLVWGAFCNAGQVCVGVKRAYLPEQTYDKILERVLEKTKKLVAGRDYGPIIDSKQLQSIQKFIADAQKDGNRVLQGGIAHGPGNFLEPTVIEISNKETSLMETECFGPVLPLIKYRDKNEAIREANDSGYGLGASVWSSDLEKARSVADRLDSGMVWINDVNVAFPEAPWGGVKDSGIGFELSEEALLEYTTAKHVSVELSKDERRFWWYPYQ